MSAHGFKAGDLVEYRIDRTTYVEWCPAVVVRVSEKTVWVGSIKFPESRPHQFRRRTHGGDWFHRSWTNLRLRKGVMR